MGWAGLMLSLAVSFFAIPRLLGIALSLLVFKPLKALPFEVSVGSASIGRLRGVTVRLRPTNSMKQSVGVQTPPRSKNENLHVECFGSWRGECILLLRVWS